MSLNGLPWDRLEEVARTLTPSGGVVSVVVERRSDGESEEDYLAREDAAVEAALASHPHAEDAVVVVIMKYASRPLDRESYPESLAREAKAAELLTGSPGQEIQPDAAGLPSSRLLAARSPSSPVAPEAAQCVPEGQDRGPAPIACAVVERGEPRLLRGRGEQLVRFYLRDGRERVRVESTDDPYNTPDRPIEPEDRDRWPEAYAAFLARSRPAECDRGVPVADIFPSLTMPGLPGEPPPKGTR